MRPTSGHALPPVPPSAQDPPRPRAGQDTWQSKPTKKAWNAPAGRDDLDPADYDDGAWM
jgi:hypothetical protein